MNTWDAIRSRRNVRAFADQPLPEGDLRRILEAGRLAPSAANRQRWAFIAVTERAQLQELAQVWRGAGHVATSAATVALTAPAGDDAARASIQYDLGQATAYMMIAAADLGIGSGHAGAHDQELARRVLGFPEDWFCAWLIAFGYPAEGPLRPLSRLDRRPFDEVVHWGRW